MRFIPCGVSSNAHAITSAIGNPIDDCEHDQVALPNSEFQRRENLCRDLNQQPAYDRIRDGYLVHIAPLQLSEKLHGFAFTFRAFISIGRRPGSLFEMAFLHQGCEARVRAKRIEDVVYFEIHHPLRVSSAGLFE